MTPPSDRIPSPASERAATCGSCGYDLVGIQADCCPECGKHIPCPRLPDPEALRRFLSGRDIYCKYDLRGMSGNRCPECGTEYYLVGGISRGEGVAMPVDPAEFAGGCLALAAAPAVLLIAGEAAAAAISFWFGRPVLGRPAVAIPLGLVPVLMLLAVRRFGEPRRGAWARTIMVWIAAMVGVAGFVGAVVVALGR